MLHKKLGNRLNHVLIITNGSRNKTLYDNVANLAKSFSISMNISIHTDHVDMSHILQLIENLSQNVDLNFSIMFNPDKREMVHEIYDTMFEYRKKYGFKMGVVTLRAGDRVDPRYTPEDFAWQKKAISQFEELVKNCASQFSARTTKRNFIHVIRDIVDNGETKTVKIGNRFVELSNGGFQFRGMYCIAHAALVSVSEDGNCRGMVCGDDKVICNIYKENAFRAVSDKLIHAVRCTRPICGCSSNDRIPKFTSEEEAKKYVEFAQKRQAELFAEYDVAQKEKKISSVESVPNKQADLSNEQNSTQSLTKNFNRLPWMIASHEIVGMSENFLNNYFGAADVVRKITEYEYNSGDKKSKVVYKVQDGIVTEITCSIK